MPYRPWPTLIVFKHLSAQPSHRKKNLRLLTRIYMLEPMKLSVSSEPLFCETACSHGSPIARSSTFLPLRRPAPSGGKSSRTVVVHVSARDPPPLPRKIGYHLNASREHFLGTLQPASSPVTKPLVPGLPLSILGLFALVPPSLAAAEAGADVPGKINIEAVVVGIDNFFNRYPFFVSGVTFIWLVVIPLTQEYLKKYKRVPALDAFRKLKDEPCAQLLDIRKQKSLNYLPSPSLKVFKKTTAQVEFVEGGEEGFVEEVRRVYGDPGNTVVCVLDDFGVDSLKVAELLVNKGFKEAYAIKDGLRGKNGWQAIQETLLPASVHVYPRKKKSKTATSVRHDEGKMSDNNVYNGTPGLAVQGETELEPDQAFTDSTTIVSKIRSSDRPLSPYPNYEDLKPPSSPSPTKPQ